MLDLKAQYRTIEQEITAAISEVCDSQIFILGPKVQQLEIKVAAYSQCTHGIGVSSGSDALLIALMALDIGPGDEVITSPFSFFATAGVVSRLNARTVFCDIDSTSYNLDASRIEHFLKQECRHENGKVFNQQTGGQIKAIIPVHLFGQMADMGAIMPLAQEFNLKVVEDAAQAIGSESAQGQRAGSIGDIGCLSFFPSKNLGAFGDAGMCVTNDDALAEKLKTLRVHGGKPKYYHTMIGGNFRLDALQAAVLLAKLEHLDQWTAARQQNAKHYNALLAGLDNTLSTPVKMPGVRHIYNQYTLFSSQRDALQQHLKAHQIGNEIYYPVPLHRQECFAYLGYGAGSCPVAETAAASVLSIPVYPELTQRQREHVVDIITQFHQQQ